VTAILLVTVGIGANIAVFTLANFVLLKAAALRRAQPADEGLGKAPGLQQDGAFSSQLS
jgi:hypothetical protein